MTVQSSLYKKFIIISADGERSVTIDYGDFRVLNIYYYENILSPNITGVVTITSTIVTKSATDIQERMGSLHSSLPLEVGCELLIHIQDPIGEGLNFSSEDNPHERFYVNEVQVLERTSTSEIIQLRFISNIGWKNTTRRVTRHYAGRITESVRNILKNELRLPDDKIEIDPSSNSYSFAGMTKRPFDLITMLAKQSIPQNTVNPGYLTFETKGGFKYLSVDTLVNSTPYPQDYSYYGFNESSYEPGDDKNNNFKIASLTVSQDQNLVLQIESGVYANKTIFFDPATYKFTEIDISVNTNDLFKNPKFSTLGKQPSIPKLLQDDFDSGTKFHRVETAILNVGANKESVTVNNSPQFYYAASATRYNLLFSQQTSITIPCNTDLEAGDVLNLQIEDISNKPDLGPDQRRGGRYIIKSLCHYFEPEKSVTSLVLIRDSYGLHTNQTV